MLKKSFLFFGVFFVLLSLADCGGVVGSSATATGGSDTTDTGDTGDTTSSADSLDAGEAGLFSDGPIDLPVTIAKLQSPNSEQIDLSVTEPGTSNLIKPNAPRFLSAGETYSCEFTGSGDATDSSLRAIPDPVTTPYVLIYDAASATSVIETVASDGSFTATIACQVEQNLIVAALTADSLASAQSSPVVIFSVDELGTVTVTITHSNRINDAQPFGADPYGNVIFSVIEDDGTYTLWRRNLDGSLPDMILENHDSEPIVVVAMADMTTEDSVVPPTVVLMDRGVDLTKIEESDDESFVPTTLAAAVGTIPDDENNGKTKRYGLFPIALDRVLLARPSTDDATRVLEVYWTEDGTVTTILGATVNNQATAFADMKVVFKNLSSTFVALRTSGQTVTNIYKIDILDEGEGITEIYESAWQNKTNVILNLPYYLHSLNPTTAGLYVLAESPTTGKYEIGKIVQGVYTTVINVTDAGINPYPRVFIDPEGRSALLCDQGETPGESEARFSLIYLLDTSDGFVDFATNGKLRSCNHMRITTMQSTANDLLHFFTQEAGDSSSQMSYINLTTNEIVHQYDP